VRRDCWPAVRARAAPRAAADRSVLNSRCSDAEAGAEGAAEEEAAKEEAPALRIHKHTDRTTRPQQQKGAGQTQRPRRRARAAGADAHCRDAVRPCRARFCSTASHAFPCTHAHRFCDDCPPLAVCACGPQRAAQLRRVAAPSAVALPAECAAAVRRCVAPLLLTCALLAPFFGSAAGTWLRRCCGWTRGRWVWRR